MRFIHAADIHLDSPRSGLDRIQDAPADEIQRAPRRALENLVRLCLEEKADFLLIAGDLYDGDWKDYRTGLFFIDQMKRLRDAGIPVVLIAGNHDAASRMTRTLQLPDNVRMLGSKAPETYRIESLQVAIHGQSFAKQAVLEDLSSAYPAKVSGWFNIGLLHTCATNTEHDPYAPCTPQGLQRKGYDYWALGHVHTRQPLHSEGEPPIHFPGNLQGRNVRETGPKGCLIVDVDSRGKVSTEFRTLDVFRWEICRVDATGAERGDDVIQLLSDKLRATVTSAEGRPLAVRVEMTGACRAHEELGARPRHWLAEIESTAAQMPGQVWIEKVSRRTTLPQELDQATLLDGPVGELVEFIRELKQNDNALELLVKDAADLAALQSRLPASLQEGSDRLDLTSPTRARELLDDVRQMLTQRLLQAGNS